MRENRTYGSEGGGNETNRSSLPLSILQDAKKRSHQLLMKILAFVGKFVIVTLQWRFPVLPLII
jgi:hypothetical protein